MSSLFDGLDFRSLGRAPGFAEEGQPRLIDDDDDMKVGAGLHSKQKIELLKHFERISNPKSRRALIDMARALSEGTDRDDAA